MAAAKGTKARMKLWRTEEKSRRQAASFSEDKANEPYARNKGSLFIWRSDSPKHTRTNQTAELDSMAITEHRGRFGTQRKWSWRQWSNLTTLRKMDLEGLYSSAWVVMNDGHVTSLFWNKREPRVCAGRHGLHVESLQRVLIMK